MIAHLCFAIVVFFIAIFLQMCWIALMDRWSMGEAIKPYGPKTHEKKRGTPSMGGVVALAAAPVSAASIWAMGGGSAQELLAIWVFPIAASAIGLLDDGLKRWTHTSEGLKSLQKLFLQIAVTLPWSFVMTREGLGVTQDITIDGAAAVVLLTFLGVGVMNAVNVTDGLDGLAGGAVAISLAVFLVLSKGGASAASAMTGLALVLAFLWHNSNPAQVFMGDVGAHLWAGLLLSLCVSEGRIALVIPLGFLFGIEIICVAIQIFAIRRLGRKVFLMSPLHHHYELRGWAETKIVARFLVAHLIGMAVSLAILNAVFSGGVYDGIRL